MLVKKTQLFSALLLALLVVALATPVVAEAQRFEFIEPLPGISGERDNLFVRYVNGAFIILLSLSAFLAVLMIVIGGVEYVVSSVNEAAKKDAKERIWGAVGGLLIVLAAYIILYTINPDLVSLKLFVPEAGEALGAVSPAGSGDENMAQDGEIDITMEDFESRTEHPDQSLPEPPSPQTPLESP